MEDFLLFIKLGFEHITDLNGYDHLLFIVALCAIFDIKDWKYILLVVTCFTIGHSITLALAIFKIVTIKSEIIEFLIPVTIMITALSNLFYKMPDSSFTKHQNQISRYFITTIFGLIHGLGFSNYLRSLLGNNTSIIKQLFAFNVGLELGQILIVAIFMCIYYLLFNIFEMKRKDINLVVSSFVAGITLTLLIEKWIF
jgi:hypothetical protein